jgi:hypothetical protein
MRYKKLQDVLDSLSPFLKNIEIDSNNAFLPTLTVYLLKDWEILEHEEINISVSPLNNKSNMCFFSSETLILDDVISHIHKILVYNQEKEEKQKLIEQKLEELKQEMLTKNLTELKKTKLSDKKDK